MINKEEIIKKTINKSDKILVSNVLDKYIKNIKTGLDTYTNFLDLREYNLIVNILRRYKIIYKIYKPIPECEKTIVYFGNYNNYVSIYKINIKEVEHKDVLGILFSIGFNYDTIGDIFIEDNHFYITNLTKLNQYLEINLTMIKNKRIELKKVDSIELTKERFSSFNIVIPSYRIDVIVSKLAHISRNDSLTYLKNKLIFVNYEEVTNSSKFINKGDIISIRKVGKFIISDELSKSKKDNILLEVKKYI